MDNKWRILLLGTKKIDPNYYICLAIEDAFKKNDQVELVVNAHYGNAIEQAVKHSCNFFLAYGGEEMEMEVCRRLKAACGCSAVWFTEDPYEFSVNQKRASLFDLIFTNDKACSEKYGPNAHHLPFGASKKFHYLHYPESDESFLYDLLFVGTAWPNRVDLIKAIEPHIADLRFKFALPTNEFLPPFSLEQPEFTYNWKTPNNELARMANLSKITLMLGRVFSASGNIAKSDTPGPRLFETALSCGFQLLDDSIADFSPYFTPDIEAITFSGPDDCLEKIRFYLENPAIRKQIATNAQKRALNSHTYGHRIQKILDEAAKISFKTSSSHGLSRSKPVAQKHKPTILMVSHNVEGSVPYGGVEVYQGMIKNSLYKDYHFLFFVPDGPSVTNYVLKDSNYNTLELFQFDYSVGDGVFYNSDRENAFAKILIEQKVNLVHFQHLFRHTFSLPFIAKALGIPTILTIHDYFLLCHSYNLIGYQGRYCQAPHIPPTSCDICLNASGNPGSQYMRRAFFSEMLKKIDLIHLNSEATAEIIKTAFPMAESFSQMEIFGIPVRTQYQANPQSNKQAFNVAVPGNFTRLKGADDVIQAMASLRDEDIHFHIFGYMNKHYEGVINKMGFQNLTIHGVYDENILLEKLGDMDVSLHLSIWPETYCITLSEAWQCRVVPIVTDIGAPGKRVEHNKTGIKVPPHSPGHVVFELLRLKNNPEHLHKLKQNITKHLWIDSSEHSKWLEQRYFQLISSSKTQKFTENSGYAPGLSLSDCNIFLVQDTWRARPVTPPEQVTTPKEKARFYFQRILNYYHLFGLRALIERLKVEVQRRIQQKMVKFKP